jgi:hypothetical protein
LNSLSPPALPALLSHPSYPPYPPHLPHRFYLSYDPGVLRAGRIVLLVLLVRWTALFLLWPMREDVIGGSFLHLIDLPFHEAGHILFSPFGDFMTTFGGSLMQVLVPMICMIAFTTSQPNPFGAAVTCWWAGQSLLDVAIYINDARALQLTLVGGHTGAEVEGHDWERILQMTGLTMHDHQIAWTTHVVGALAMIGALVWGTILTLRNEVDHRGHGGHGE